MSHYEKNSLSSQLNSKAAFTAGICSFPSISS
uniref:Uncharacterized protein n=1 Tax=Anguilla anguilla TaxID=7936 RepID=A0A0E9PRR4_ANGAN